MPGAHTPTRSADSPCPADLAEAAAILLDREPGLAPEHARGSILANQGFASEAEFVAARAREIRSALAVVPSGARDVERLTAVTLAFIASPLFATATLHGWTDTELFGLSPDAPHVRVAEQGLVSGLALSSLNGPKLIAIEPDVALVRCASGSVLRHQRFRERAGASQPWWDLPHFVRPRDFAFPA
jgi:hypothetical protein